MKSKKISILASSTVILLSVGLLAGCAGDPEDEENKAAIVAPILSEGATTESAAVIEEENFNFEGIEPIESISDMLSDAVKSTDDDIDTAVDSMLGVVETTESLTEDTQATALEVIGKSPVLGTINDAADVVPATSGIVRSVQQGLADAGFNPGPVDGASGSRTVAAIKDFQSQNNLKANGQLTKETLRALGVNF